MAINYSQSLGLMGNTNPLDVARNVMGLGQLSRDMSFQQGQRDTQLKEQERLNKFRAGIQELDVSDPQAVQAFMQANPEYMKDIAAISNYGDAKRQDLIGRTAVQLDQALASGNAEAAYKILEQNRGLIDGAGDPSFTTDSAIQMMQTDPEGFRNLVRGTAASALGTDQYLAATQPQQLEQMSPYQQAQIEGKNQDRELRRQEIELRRLESEQKRAKTSLDQEAKSQEIEQKKKEIEDTKAQDQQALDDKIFLAKNNAEQVKNLLSNQDFIDDLTGISGVAQGFGFKPSQNARDAQIIFDNIVSSETLNNLDAMTGPLTDKDVEVIRSASTRLREGMSEKAMKLELKKMLSAYDRIINNYQKEANRKGYKTEDGNKASSKVVFSSSKYGDVTEADIQTTMKKHNMTREQVMSRLGK